MWNVYRLDDRGNTSHLIATSEFSEAASCISRDIKLMTGRDTIGQLMNEPGSFQTRSFRLPTDVRESWMIWVFTSSAPTVAVDLKEPLLEEVVEFTWPYDYTCGVNQKEFQALQRCFKDAFGGMMPTRPVQIKCRLDQFAKFLVLRNESYCRDGFKQLNPKIVADTNVLDTTRNWS